LVAENDKLHKKLQQSEDEITTLQTQLKLEVERKAVKNVVFDLSANQLTDCVAKLNNIPVLREDELYDVPVLNSEALKLSSLFKLTEWMHFKIIKLHQRSAQMETVEEELTQYKFKEDVYNENKQIFDKTTASNKDLVRKYNIAQQELFSANTKTQELATQVDHLKNQIKLVNNRRVLKTNLRQVFYD